MQILASKEPASFISYNSTCMTLEKVCIATIDDYSRLLNFKIEEIGIPFQGVFISLWHFLSI